MPALVKPKTSLRHYHAALLILLLGSVLSGLAARWETAQEQQRLLQRFEFLAQERAGRLQAGIDRALHSLYATGALFDASEQVTRAEFNDFLRELIRLHPDIHGIEWLPRVRDNERAAFEASARAEGLTDFQITEEIAPQNLVPAARRETYFPVFYAVPEDRNRKALGFDSYNQHDNNTLMDVARDRGAVLATAAFVLVQDPEQRLSTVIYRPVYRDGKTPEGVEARRDQLLGFVVILLRIADFAGHASAHSASNLDWILVDTAAPTDQQRLYQHLSRPRVTPAGVVPTAAPGDPIASVALQLPGRQWRAHYTPTPGFYARFGAERGWLVLATGLTLTAVLTYFIGSRIRRTLELEYLARRDFLTGLPNRALLTERLAHALDRARRDGGQLALLFLDLDRFKHINDSLGHTAGDRMLGQVAGRLSQALRVEDTLARMGGDEFVVLMEHLQNEREAALLADRLIQTLVDSIDIDGVEIFLTTSIGISLYPQDADNAEGLISNADAAMYRAKAEGRNTYQFYTPELTRIAHEQVTLVGNLKHALERRELSLVYQPQHNLADGRAFGVEALLRWHPGQAEVIMPERFIPLAEETGLIVPIGAWVLHEACRQARRWLDEGVNLQRLSVNLSAQQLHRGAILETVRQALADTGLPADKLELEVTESILMTPSEAPINTLNELRRLGVAISVDDFGTGYSSLARLKRLPIDRLKIDRGFVQDLPHDADDTAIARAIIALGHNLSLRVLAEGVESAEQAAFLLREGCDEAQGDYYSIPVPAEAIAAFFATQPRASQAPQTS
ncbi:MAG: putative bifunctional diguanylate cyclase/phosphodiesterase [Gammaproteobacteria bacterium]